MSYKTIVFDLDDTLLDTSGLLIPISNTAEFLDRIRSPLPLMPGALDNLKFLSKKYPLILLSFGNLDIQRDKINSLSISQYFTDIYLADSTKNESKAQYFNLIYNSIGQQPNSFLSVGNRRSTDIRFAKQSFGATCLLKYGEHKNEPIEIPEDIPDFEIIHNSELISKCQL